MNAVIVPLLLIVRAFVVWTFVAVTYKLPVTDKFETERYSMFAFPGTVRFESVARGPVKVIFDVTVRVCVFVVAIFAVVAKTSVVVRAFDAYMFPMTFRVVSPVKPTIVAVERFDKP